MDHFFRVVRGYLDFIQIHDTFLIVFSGFFKFWFSFKLKILNDVFKNGLIKKKKKNFFFAAVKKKNKQVKKKNGMQEYIQNFFNNGRIEERSINNCI